MSTCRAPRCAYAAAGIAVPPMHAPHQQRVLLPYAGAQCGSPSTVPVWRLTDAAEVISVAVHHTAIITAGGADLTVLQLLGGCPPGFCGHLTGS